MRRKRYGNITHMWLHKTVVCGFAFFSMLYLASAFIGYLHPHSAGYLSLLALAYPLMLIIEVCFAFLLMLVERRLLIVLAVVLAATWPQISAFCPLNFTTNNDCNFRLMTYNTYGMTNRDAEDERGVLGQILDNDADFVCLQEAQSDELFRYYTTDDVLRQLKERYPYIHLSGENIGYMSKRPVTLLTEKHEDMYFYYAIYRTDVDGQLIFIINTHLQSIGLSKKDKQLYMHLTHPTRSGTSLRGVRSGLMTKLRSAFTERAPQAEKIDSLARNLTAKNPDAAIIIAGDFNDTPYSYAYLQACNGRRDAYRDGGLGPVVTYNSNRFYFHIDQILYEGNIKATKCRRGHSRSSDHYSLTADFKIVK